MHDADTLVAAHLTMLGGSYVSQVIAGPGAARYVYSAATPDVTTNFGLGITAKTVAWLEDTARAHRRSPAFLAMEGTVPGEVRATLHPARWMVADARMPAGDEAGGAGLNLRLTEAPAPDATFLDVFCACHDGGPIDAHVSRFYAPALAAARPVAGVTTCHAVLLDGREPVACATLHVAGRLAGLYNVGTRRSRQGAGLALLLTRRLVGEAARLGAVHVFLQCPAGTHVERLYGRAGFRAAFSPVLVCPEAP